MLRKILGHPSLINKSLLSCRLSFFSAASSRSPLNVLKERGLVNQASSELLDDPAFIANIKEKYNIDSVSSYVGYDPTADSLHLGNLLSIMSLIRLKEIGIKPIFLVGGATGFIGDPSGKSKDRELLESSLLENNASRIDDTLKKVVRNILLYLKDNKEKLKINYDLDMNYEVINNYEFYKEMSALEFIRDIGRHFRLGVLLNKESVSARMESQEGMSFMEFSYQLFQANDYLKLFNTKNCVLQLGGSDQWGNITNGCDLIRKVMKKESFALTLPLLLTSAGKKFGKSEGNAIWIDSKKTDPRDLFQFLFNTPDSDVVDLLKKFTFYDLETINQIEKEHLKEPEKRKAQKLLAETVIDMLNYEETKEKPASSFQIFFETDFQKIKEYNIEQLRSHFKGIKPSKISKNDIQAKNMKILDVIAHLKIKPSKNEARRLVSGNGFSINGDKFNLDEAMKFDCLDKSNYLGGLLLVLQFGKKDFHLVELVEA